MCFDLDGTLCTNTYGDYASAEPFPWAIERVNALAAAGHRIVVFTARGTATGIDWTEVTRDQLDRWGVSYDELRLGKPSADVFVDDRAVHTDSWRVSHMAGAPGFTIPGPAQGEALPVAPPSHLTSVVEIGRTFAGRPLWLAEHVARALARAAAAGIRSAPTADALERAALEALAGQGDDDELVYAITIWDGGHAAYLDALPTASQSQGGHVSCRSLRQAAAALTRFATGEPTDIPVVRASTGAPPDPDAWPLVIGDDGQLRDALGGRLALATGDRLVVERSSASEVGPIARLLSGCGADERDIEASELAAADELLIVGLPFGVVVVGELDGRPIGAGTPGDAAAQVTEAWSRAVGFDVAAQALAFAQKGRSVLEPESAGGS